MLINWIFRTAKERISLVAQKTLADSDVVDDSALCVGAALVARVDTVLVDAGLDTRAVAVVHALWQAGLERISLVAHTTLADWVVFDDTALRIDAARSGAGVDAVLVDAGLDTRAVVVDHAL